MITWVQYGVLVIFNMTLIFHLLVLFKVIPYQLVWGGRLKSDKDMYRFETVSILMTLLFIFFMLIQSNIIDIQLPEMLSKGMLYFMAFLFFVNTLGNLKSKNKYEKLIFTPITILLSILFLFLSIKH